MSPIMASYSADELVVLDVGAEVEHYAADITRTVSLGKPSRPPASSSCSGARCAEIRTSAY